MSTYIFSQNVVIGAQDLIPKSRLIKLDGQWISSIEEMDEAAAKQVILGPMDQFINLGRDLVTPTFINAHTHLSMSVFRGIGTEAFGGNIVEDLYYRLEENLQASDVKAFAHFAAYESILAGTGMVWDHYYFGTALAEGLAQAGLPAVVAPTLQDLSGPGVKDLEQQLDATLELNSQEWSKRGIFAALGPHATDTVSDELWSKVAVLADKFAFPIHAHAAQSPEEYARMIHRHGISPIRFLKEMKILDVSTTKLLVHGLYVSHEDLELLRGTGSYLGFCPYSQLQFGFPARARHWSQAGIEFALGTDCGASNDSMDVQQELRLAATGYAFGISDSTPADHFFSAPSLERAQQIESHRLALRREHTEAFTQSALLGSVWDVPGMFHSKAPCGKLAPNRLGNIAIWDLDHPSLWPSSDISRTLVMNHCAPALKGMFLLGQQRGEIGDFRSSIMNEEGFIEARKEAIERRESFLRRLT